MLDSISRVRRYLPFAVLGLAFLWSFVEFVWQQGNLITRSSLVIRGTFPESTVVSPFIDKQQAQSQGELNWNLPSDFGDESVVSGVRNSTPTENSRQQRTIYSQLRKDQSGWVIFDMLKAHAYTFFSSKGNVDAIYGGACGESVHKSDVQKVLRAVGWDEILPLKCPVENDTLARIYPSSLFEKSHGRRMGSSAWRRFIQNHSDYSYFDEVATKSQRKDDNRTVASIVVHVRRRDVTPCCYPGWYLPNSYFLQMIDKFKKEFENAGRDAKVYIFSQQESYEPWDDFVSNNTDIRLHFDGPVGEVWRAILSADVFIGSISEFSRVPSLFARGQIPNPRNISDPIISRNTRIERQRLFNQCTDMDLVSCKHKWWLKNHKS